MIIRILLLALLAAIGWFIFLKRNRLPFHIVTMFGLLAAGAVAVVVPQQTDRIAQFVGVGRGADLIIYLVIVAVLFVLIHYFSKFVELEQKVTQLTRELAILRAEVERVVPPATQPSGPTSATPDADETPARRALP
jgi:hypothetical protein